MSGTQAEKRCAVSRSIRPLLIAAAVTVVAASASHGLAASATWNASPTSGDWVPGSTDINWAAQGAFPGSTTVLNNQDVATFSTTDTTTIAINSASLNVKSITFGVSGSNVPVFTIGSTTGNALYLTTAGTLSSATGVTNTVTQTVNAPLVVGTGATAGTYTISALAATGSALQINGTITGAAGTVGTPTTTLLNIGGVNTASALSTISGVIQNGANNTLSLTKLGSSAMTWSLAGANTYTGKTSILGGVMQIYTLGNVGAAAATSLGAPTNVTTGTIDLGLRSSGATLQFVGGDVTSDRVINIGGDGIGNTLDASGTSGKVVLTGGISVGSSITPGANGSINNTAKTLQLIGSNTNYNELSGSIVNGDGTSQTVSVLKNGTGTWLLSGSNSFSGGTTVQGGTLAIGSDGALGTTNSIFTNNNSNTSTAIEAYGADRTLASLSSASNLRIGGGHTLTVTSFVNNTAVISVDSGTTFSLPNAFGLTATTNRNLTISGDGSAVLAGTISNGGTATASSLSKTGNGTLTLNGANTYGGATSLTGGLLLANNAAGSATGTGAVVITGGKLGGNGHVVPTGTAGISLSNTGTRLSPGDAGAGSIGNLELAFASTTGSLTMGAGTGFEFNLAAPASSLAAAGTDSTGDRLLINGIGTSKVAIATGGNTVDFLNTGSDGYYKIIDTDQAFATPTTDIYNTNLVYATTGGSAYQITAGLNAVNVPGGGTATFFIGSGLTGGGDAGDIYVRLVGVPEPASLSLLGVAGALALRRKRINH